MIGASGLGVMWLGALPRSASLAPRDIWSKKMEDFNQIVRECGA